MPQIRYLQVVLYVNVGDDRTLTEQEVYRRLHAWFAERVTGPYGPGDLMHYETAPDLIVVEFDPQVYSGSIRATKTQ